MDPLIGLLRRRITPKQLTWSLAAGFVIGVNPLLGSTTVLALAVAYAFGLNLVASQLANHLVYPLELLLFPVFVRLGSLIFRTAPLPMNLEVLSRAVRAHPWDTTRLLWRWEWHALVAWAIFAMILCPGLAFTLHPVLHRMLDRLDVRAMRPEFARSVLEE